MEFEKDTIRNLLALHNELRTKTYKPLPLTTFVLRDPQTRVISKSDFRDRVVHHALINVIKPFLEKQFIYDSCANQINKGTFLALKRFYRFLRKVSDPLYKSGFCLKADIKHYFYEVDHDVLMNILKRKIHDANVLWLIENILSNGNSGGGANAGEACRLETTLHSFSRMCISTNWIIL